MKVRYQFMAMIFPLIFLYSLYDNAHAESVGLDLNYHIEIDNPSEHVCKVGLEIKNIESNKVILARMLPEVTAEIYDISVSNLSGTILPFNIDKTDPEYESYIIDALNSKSILVEYKIDLNYKLLNTVGTPWGLDTHYGAFEAEQNLIQSIFDSVSNCKVFSKLPENWKMVSRLIENTGYSYANLDDKVATYMQSIGSICRFILWGPMAFGDFEITTRIIGGINISVAVYGDSPSKADFVELIFSVFSYLTQTIGPMNEPKNSEEIIKYLYVFLINEDPQVHIGGHEYGQIMYLEDTDPGGHGPDKVNYRMHSHIIAHTWISGAWLSTGVVYSNWATEGLIQYFALQSLSETGLWDSVQVNNYLKYWYTEYLNKIKGTQYDVPIYKGTLYHTFPEDIWYVMDYNQIPLIYYLLNKSINEATQGQYSFGDIWRFCHDHYPGNPIYLISRENLSGNINMLINLDQILRICNFVTGYDFTPFFLKFIFDNTALPYYTENNTLKIDISQIPVPKLLSSVKLAQIGSSLHFGDIDSDTDGLNDKLEDIVGSDKNKKDSDGDGLSDREELGVFIDGLPGEPSTNPTISDPLGDNQINEHGTDIESVHACVFINEDSKKYLYIKVKTKDNQYNEGTYIQINIFSNNANIQYFFQRGKSELINNIGEEKQFLLTHDVNGQFSEQLEVIIPLEIIGYEQVNMGIAIVKDTIYGPVDCDSTDFRQIDLNSILYSTNPLKADSDGDGYPDGQEISAGTDPTDRRSCPGTCPVRAMPWIPILILND